MKTFLNGLLLNDLTALLEGEIVQSKKNGSTVLSYICTDSREVEENSVFVALVGENTDGHKYIDIATDKGAVLVICERLPERINENVTYAVVENSEKQLLVAAKAYRKKYCDGLSSVAVTGSVGKTTAKEIIYSALTSRLDVYKTDGNFNSVIGMPISLLGMRDTYEYAVFEMGMSGLCEIESMSRTLEPKVGVITNVGHSHLEYLKTRENILKAKLEITSGIPSDGYLIINADDEMLSKVDFSAYPFTTIKCSQVSSDADYYAYNVRFSDNRSMLFDYFAKGTLYTDCEIPGIGNHLVTTALCAIAAGECLGLTPSECMSGFSNYKNAAMRQNVMDIGGVTVIEDCYNAAPESMRSAINAMKHIKEQKKGARAVALLGDMKELGENSERLHYELGAYFAESSSDILIAVGELALNIAAGAVDAGFDKNNVYTLNSLDDIEAAGRLLDSLICEGDIFLVKASRSMKSERAVEYLKAKREDH